MPHVSWKMTWPCVLLQDIQTCRKLVGCLFILEEKILGRFTNKIYHMHYSLLLRITDDMHPSQLPLFFNIWSYIHTHIYVERDLRSYSTSKPELQNPPQYICPSASANLLFPLPAVPWRPEMEEVICTANSSRTASHRTHTTPFDWKVAFQEQPRSWQQLHRCGMGLASLDYLALLTSPTNLSCDLFRERCGVGILSTTTSLLSMSVLFLFYSAF